MIISKQHFQDVEIIQDKSEGKAINITENHMFLEPVKTLNDLNFWIERLDRMKVPHLIAKVGYKKAPGDDKDQTKTILVNGYSLFTTDEEWAAYGYGLMKGKTDE